MPNQQLNSRIIETFYTDGSCIGNPGAGGWAVLLYFADGSVYEMGAAEGNTTNNRMELQATIEALKIFCSSGQTEPITLYTDSEYVIKGITQWIAGWKKRGWKTSQGKSVLNQDLWQQLDQLTTPLVTWKHVRGHSGNKDNERCDAIARGFALGQTPTLQQMTPPFSQDSYADIPNPSVAEVSDLNPHSTVAYSQEQLDLFTSKTPMIESSAVINDDFQLPREVRVSQLNNLIDTLRIADEIASKGYLISSSELADLMDVNASAVTSRGDNWPWRNWVVSRVRREGNQILWQLERVD